jgi:hypothetical protein
MSKVIEIKKCEDCPHFSGITAGQEEPSCKKTLRVIPYKEDWDVPFPPHRTPKEDMPDWCPLESTEDFCESNFKI